jgi:hypothetical protein
MRTLLTVLNLSMLVLLAGIPDGSVRWWLAAVGAVTALLLWRLAQRERLAEVQQAGDQAIDQLLATASTVRQERSPDRDLP